VLEGEVEALGEIEGDDVAVERVAAGEEGFFVRGTEREDVGEGGEVS
jgi:hypothetical protein